MRSDVPKVLHDLCGLPMGLWPVRAALGMPAALAAQTKLAASPPAGGPPRDEALRDEVMSAAAGCIRVSGDRPWLDCYYAAAAPMMPAMTGPRIST